MSLIKNPLLSGGQRLNPAETSKIDIGPLVRKVINWRAQEMETVVFASLGSLINPLWPARLSVKEVFVTAKKEPDDWVVVAGKNFTKNAAALRKHFDYPNELAVLIIDKEEEALVHKPFLRRYDVPPLDSLNVETEVFDEFLRTLFSGRDPDKIRRLVPFPEL